MPTGLFVLIQRFPRQGIEDGSDPSATWGPDRTEADAEDPDDDDNVPIPIAVPGPATGKTRASSLRDWSEDEDDDCQILAVQGRTTYASSRWKAWRRRALRDRSPLRAGCRDQLQNPPELGFEVAATSGRFCGK